MIESKRGVAPVLAVVAALLAVLPGCGKPEARQCECQGRRVRIATTTSVDNTEVMHRLLEPFQKRTGLTVQVLAVGSGQALVLARNGDVDLVLTHDPMAEREFVQQGFGIFPVEIMHNDYVLLGPGADPAVVRGAGSPADAFSRIAHSKQDFVSRGDRSGTHVKEMEIWKQAGIQPSGRWYLEAGQGQRLALEMASQKQGYLLVDRATWLFSNSTEHSLDLELLYENPEALRNPYSVIVVSPEKNPAANVQDALALLGWLVSPEGQKIIGDHRVDSRTLFAPEVHFQP